MCIYDGKCWREVHGEVRIEADRMYVEEWDDCLVRMRRELGQEFGSDGSGCEDERVGFKYIGLGKP